MRNGRFAFALAVAGVVVLGAGSASAIRDDEGPDNPTALSFGDAIEGEDDDLMTVVCDAAAGDITPLGQAHGAVVAPDGEPEVLVFGAATVGFGMDQTAALFWYFQEPNLTKKKDDKIKVKQEANVAFAWYLFDDNTDVDPFADDFLCDSDWVLLDTCDGSLKLDGQGPEGKFKVQCDAVSPTAVAERITDADLGDLQCNNGTPSESDIADSIALFLDQGKLKISFSDPACALVDPDDLGNLED